MHDNIRDKSDLDMINQIYDYRKAKQLFIDKKSTHRQLSIMKQENIKEAILSGNYEKCEILEALETVCGYCFKYVNKDTSYFDCIICPLDKKCTRSKEFQLLEKEFESSSKYDKKLLSSLHKNWCNKLGFKEVYVKKVPASEKKE